MKVVSKLLLFTLAVISLACVCLNQKTYAKQCSKTEEPGSCNVTNEVVVNQCCDGYVTNVNASGASCSCVSADATLTEFFKLMGGIMIPLAIIGGIFLIMLAGYKILTSQGNPQELQAGKENLTSAIIGLVFVLMSVSILRVVISALITGNATVF